MDWLFPVKQIIEFALPFLNSLPLVRAFLGFALVFFLPGFAWTLVFFRQINLMERIALSFGLSIAVVTLSILAPNLLFQVRITGLNSFLTLLVVTLLPVAIYYLRKLAK